MADVPVSNDGDQCTPAKKIKVDAENGSENVNNIHDANICLSNFEIKKILQNNCSRKQVCVHGAFKGHEGSSIVLLEKQEFSDNPQSLQTELFTKDTSIQKLYSNDIYGNYECFPLKEYNGLKVMVIHPATQKHIDKFKRKELYIVDETYELYKNVTLPYIESSSFSLQWVYNILEQKAEQDKIVYEDRDEKVGFVMVNDLKWNGNVNTLKLIALPFQKILSIRELNASHLPLLRNIRDAGIEAISKKFNLPASQLRIYFHYQPSYYYLHVHFAYLMFETPGIYVEKAHLLSMVIRNLELMPDYYTKAVLSYVVAAGDPLYTKFLEEGVLSEVKSESNEAEK
ncbi:PREDICTED: m7GpppX diphosphatase [Dufourea novaeangliae]|uniref:m7GpppX diphosphatase n=1 Tax=Dufourea novaeangliae TaxID=178035 RepID=A0A154P5W8_DUFNO|nr:PREDICTED: m7GpppX diphosphatase [Dufourea novaeangliae]KZC07267.1 m7GpppX diphosphatase [Dufourea novaeangliae]